MPPAKEYIPELSPQAKQYIYRAYQEICELSKHWHNAGLIMRTWAFFQPECDISDGKKYVTAFPESKWIPIGSYSNLLTNQQVTTYSVEKHLPISITLIFQMLTDYTSSTSIRNS